MGYTLIAEVAADYCTGGPASKQRPSWTSATRNAWMRDVR
jgi:hypothetical protein